MIVFISANSADPDEMSLFAKVPIRSFQYKKGSRHALKNIKQATTCDFQQCGILTSVDSDKLCSPPLSLRNQNGVQSVA